MRTTEILLAAAGLITSVTSHATFQQLWVNGADQGSSCARLPASNSPVTSVNTNDLRCNANPGKAASKCSVPAGASITVEMHQQNGQRDCSQEGIGGNHYGPVMVYMSKVSDASTDTGSGKWFKIFELGYDAATKVWGNDGLNKGCGKQALKIPSNIAPGDYLLRAETIALHAAQSPGGAQFYMTCYQITVTGGGSANPSGVSFPGAYNAADPGITINIYNNLQSYTIPGPAVYSG